MKLGLTKENNFVLGAKIFVSTALEAEKNLSVEQKNICQTLIK